MDGEGLLVDVYEYGWVFALEGGSIKLAIEGDALALFASFNGEVVVIDGLAGCDGLGASTVDDRIGS